MKQRTAILVAIGLTAFVVILVGGIALAIAARTGAANEPANASAIPLSADGEVGQAVTVNTPTLFAPQTVSAERAVQVALRALPGSVLSKTPELVNFQGKMAYEVLLSGGTVYVDAFTAQVLSSSVTVISNTVETPVPNNSPATNNAPQGAPAENQPTFSDDNNNDNGDDDGDNNNDNGDDDDHGDNDNGDDDDDHGGHDNSGKGSSNSGKGGGGDDHDD